MRHALAAGDKKSLPNGIVFTSVILSSLIVLYAASRHNYLVFHCFVEIYSVTIAGNVFILSSFARDRETNAFSFLGMGYLFVGMLDLLHALTYQGMNLVVTDRFYANQLWVCARSIESATIFVFILKAKKTVIGLRLATVVYALLFAGALASIFWFHSFPACFVPGLGQTRFKIAAEYAICALLLASLVMLNRDGRVGNGQIRRYLSASIAITIAGEFCFTLYVDNYGLLNVIGHLLKLLSFYYIYKSMLLVNVKAPLDMIFRELNEKERKILNLLTEIEREKDAALRSSRTDALTGLYNRRHFNDTFPQAFNASRREGTALSILMIDVDFFKDYNDRYGHISGDECLIRLAGALRGALNRATDILARFGGEEFIVALQGTGKDGALRIAESMREATHGLGIAHDKSRCSDVVTISVGAVTFAGEYPDSAEAAIALADAALYRAKDNGRNRVEFFDPDAVGPE